VKDMEKELVRQLGEKIGYGNMMQLASDLWEEKMKENIEDIKDSYLELF